MKNYACIFLLAFAAIACHKEVPMSQVEVLGSQKSKLSPEKEKIVQECKEWFVASTKKASLTASVSGNAGESEEPFIGNPDWESASFFELTTNLPEFNRFPLNDYEVNVVFTPTMNPKGFRDIMLRKYGEDNFVVGIMEVHPDAAYLEQKRKEKGLDENADMRTIIDNEDFDGYFLIYSMVNGLRHGERRDNGIVTAHLQIPK